MEDIMKKKGSIISIVLLLCLSLTGCKSDPEYDKAKEKFDAQVARIEEQLEEKDKEIENAENLLSQDKEALDKSTESSLKKTIENAQKIEIEIPKIPKEVNDINNKTKELESIDITEEINDLKNSEKLLEDSRKKYDLLINPTNDFIVDRLKGVKDIDKVEGVTEDNDPNGNLNKPGGYTAQVYFSSPLVKDEYNLFTGDVIEDGTDCGGSVEVYKTVSEAQNRNQYLSSFDGSGMLSNGSHTVYGTIIIRISDELTASQQKSLEESVLNALTEL